MKKLTKVLCKSYLRKWGVEVKISQYISISECVPIPSPHMHGYINCSNSLCHVTCLEGYFLFGPKTVECINGIAVSSKSKCGKNWEKTELTVFSCENRKMGMRLRLRFQNNRLGLWNLNWDFIKSLAGKMGLKTSLQGPLTSYEWNIPGWEGWGGGGGGARKKIESVCLLHSSPGVSNFPLASVTSKSYWFGSV